MDVRLSPEQVALRDAAAQVVDRLGVHGVAELELLSTHQHGFDDGHALNAQPVRRTDVANAELASGELERGMAPRHAPIRQLDRAGRARPADQPVLGVAALGRDAFAGRGDLETYLRLAPEAADRAEIEQSLRALRSYQAGLN